jgi:hypothetical protein
MEKQMMQRMLAAIPACPRRWMKARYDAEQI